VLVATMLGDVNNSRLFYALIEPALADEAHVLYEGLDHTGAIFTYLSCDPARTAEVLDVVRDQFARFQADGPTADELAAAKNKVAAAITLSAESPMKRLMTIGNDWSYRHTYTAIEEHVDRIFAVEQDDVCRAVRLHDLTAATVLTLGPLKSL